MLKNLNAKVTKKNAEGRREKGIPIIYYTIVRLYNYTITPLTFHQQIYPDKTINFSFTNLTSSGKNSLKSFSKSS